MAMVRRVYIKKEREDKPIEGKVYATNWAGEKVKEKTYSRQRSNNNKAAKELDGKKKDWNRAKLKRFFTSLPYKIYFSKHHESRRKNLESLILTALGNRCLSCGQEKTKVTHIIPLFKNPKRCFDPHNLQPTCGLCYSNSRTLDYRSEDDVASIIDMVKKYGFSHPFAKSYDLLRSTRNKRKNSG